MVEQVASVYKKILHFTDVKVVDASTEKTYDGQVIVCTLNFLKRMLSDRKKPNLSKLQLLVMDEADSYFQQADQLEILHKVKNSIPA